MTDHRDISVRAWFARYFAWRRARGDVSVDSSESRYRVWVDPILGARGMRTLRRRDIERVVASLDAAVTARTIRWKTARGAWAELTSALRRARRSKLPDLRVLTRDIVADIEGPERGPLPTKPILFPGEVAKLLACELIPPHRRRTYAIAIATAARSSELSALQVEDVDLTHRRIRIERQRDRRTGEPRPTKTRLERTISIEPSILSLIRWLVRTRKTGSLLEPASLEWRSRILRDDLLRAGVRRPELHVGSDARLRMRFHGLRDTGLTWMAIRGDDPIHIQWRAGHTDLGTTQGYIQAGRYLAAGFGKPFPPIPTTLHHGQTGKEKSHGSPLVVLTNAIR